MVNISDDAMDYIATKIEQARSTRPANEGSIPLLAWISKAYFIANSGERTDYGPYFALQWTNENDIEHFRYVTLQIGRGDVLALAPGDLFRSGSRAIERCGDGITLVPGS